MYRLSIPLVVISSAAFLLAVLAKLRSRRESLESDIEAARAELQDVRKYLKRESL